MKTNIDNNSRVFQVITSTQNTAFCNIEDLNVVMKDLQVVEGYYTIYTFWGNKRLKISNKELKGMFDNLGIVKEF